MMSPKLYFSTSPQTAGTGTTWSVALNTTHTGAVLSNPASSGKDLVLVSASFQVSAAPAAIVHVGLFSGFAAAGITVHTTAGVVQVTRNIGDTEDAVGLFDTAATLVGTPRWMKMLGTVPILAVFDQVYPVFEVKYPMGGEDIVIPPGGYVGIGCSTAAVGYADMYWYERKQLRT